MTYKLINIEHLNEVSHDVLMIAAAWSEKLAYAGYLISLKREEQILKRMDSQFGVSNYYS